MVGTRGRGPPAIKNLFSLDDSPAAMPTESVSQQGEEAAQQGEEAGEVGLAMQEGEEVVPTERSKAWPPCPHTAFCFSCNSQ